ncbi:MAG: hypothetical protein K0R51_1145 [Cytophagaceae bacterium]|jgi:hypothetical protein|nr:hypothetical protein [Cytophagaceae bacterium]
MQEFYTAAAFGALYSIGFYSTTLCGRVSD